MGHEEVGFRLGTYNSFLGQEIGELQLRYSQSASCLPSEMEVTMIQGKYSVFVSCKHLNVIVMVRAKR